MFMYTYLPPNISFLIYVHSTGIYCLFSINVKGFTLISTSCRINKENLPHK